jgi:hypothetical protein
MCVVGGSGREKKVAADLWSGLSRVDQASGGGVVSLLDNDRTEEQAKGLLDSLNLNGGVPDWEPQ